MALARGTAHPINYAGVFVREAGGVVQFSTAELGHALGNANPESPLPAGTVNLLLLKYAEGDARDASALFRALSASFRKRDQGWSYAIANGRLCWVAIQEAVGSRTCEGCAGTRFVRHIETWEPCKRCGGIGRRRLSTRELGEKLGMDHTTVWRQVLNPYSERLNALTQMEDIGLFHVWNKTRGL